MFYFILPHPVPSQVISIEAEHRSSFPAVYVTGLAQKTKIYSLQAIDGPIVLY